jgi:hypothetical protein
MKQEDETMQRSFGVLSEDHDGTKHTGGIYPLRSMAERAAAVVAAQSCCKLAYVIEYSNEGMSR